MADEYINELEINGQKRLDLTQDTATPEAVLEGETFHLRSGAPATGTYRPSDEIVARLRATVGHSSKNLYQITVDTQTINGVTFNVDKANGTITVNGTSPSNKEATLKQSFIVTKNLAGKKYFSVSLNQTGSSTTFDAYIYDNTAHKFVAKWDGSTRSPYIYGTESQEVLLIEGHTVEYTCRIFKNQTVSNLIYKPMIRDGSISDDSFEPYVTPTDEKKQDKPVELDPTVLTWNIADLQSKYTHIQIICECISTSSTPNMDIYDVITIPTIIFGRTANSEKYIAFASGTSFSGVDGVYFTEANGNVTADITSSTGHGTRNIIQIIGIPK